MQASDLKPASELEPTNNLNKSKFRMDLTSNRLKEVMIYSPDTGIFTRRVKIGRYVAGSKAGSKDKAGYIQVCVDGVIYFAHRLAFLYMMNRWPEALIDHINTNRSDNSWLNLREATPTQNHRNKKVYKTSLTGIKGILKTKSGYCTKISIGTYKTLDEAIKAYEQMARLINKEFTHHSVGQLNNANE